MAKERIVRVPMLDKYKSPVRLSTSSLEGSPDEVIKVMQELKADYPGKTLELVWEQEPHDDYYSMFVYESRPENAEEKDARLTAERLAKERREAHDRATYERLQKQFGDSK